MQQNKIEFVTIEKLFEGTLVLYFENIFEYGKEIPFIIDAREEKKRIPVHLAASMFVKGSTYSAYKNKMFKFADKDYDLVYSFAVDNGLTYEDKKATEQNGVVYSAAQMKNFLTMGRKKEIESIINEGGSSQVRLLFEVTKENANKINYEIIQIVENAVGLEITIGE